MITPTSVSTSQKTIKQSTNEIIVIGYVDYCVSNARAIYSHARWII